MKHSRIILLVVLALVAGVVIGGVGGRLSTRFGLELKENKIAAANLAVDYHLYPTGMFDGEYTERPGSGKSAPTIYVLSEPGGQNPVVFQKLDSPMMEVYLRFLSVQAHGIVVHFHGSAVIEPRMGPTAAEWDGFKTFCRTHDITFLNQSATD